MPKEFIDGNSYNDDPNQEYKSSFTQEPSHIYEVTGSYVFPCYVYDKRGTLLRIEYPKYKEPKKWTSRYSSY